MLPAQLRVLLTSWFLMVARVYLWLLNKRLQGELGVSALAFSLETSILSFQNSLLHYSVAALQGPDVPLAP